MLKDKDVAGESASLQMALRLGRALEGETKLVYRDI